MKHEADRTHKRYRPGMKKIMATVVVLTKVMAMNKLGGEADRRLRPLAWLRVRYLF